MKTDRKVIVLGLAMALTAVVAFRGLILTSNTPTESGFDGADPFSLVTTVVPSAPTNFRPPSEPRNPFTDNRPFAGGGGTEAEDDGDDESSSGEGESGAGETASPGQSSTSQVSPADLAGTDLVATQPLTDADFVRDESSGRDR